MYLPNVFREDDPAALQALMREHSFAILVTQHEGRPFATHLPFLLDAGRGPHGTLLAHMARANPQWRDFDGQSEALVIFQGPHAYISPSWYETAPSVPTWNYAIVHAYGVPRVIADAAELEQTLGALVDHNEAGFEHPWEMRLPDEYMHRQMQAIVGFEIPIARLEGKLKLSQNRGAADRRGVVAALGASPDPATAAVAHMVAHAGAEPRSP